MGVNIDTHELRQFDIQLARVGKSFDERVMGRILRDASKPTLAAARNEVPIGKRKIKSGLTRRTKSGKTKRDGTYDKGGSTRRDLRIKVVRGVGQESVRVLIGVSKSRGKVGWRTHFITRANLHRKAPNDFLARAESQTINVVVSQFGASAQTIINRVLQSYAK